MIEDLENWLKEHQIQYNLRRNDIIDIPGFGKCLYQDMTNRDHLFKEDKETKEVRFSCVENLEYLVNDDVLYVIVKFGKRYYYIGVQDKKEELKVLSNIGTFVGTETQCDFYPLGCHSSFELLNGSGSLAQWCNRAKFLGYKGLATCDLNTLASSLDLQREATASELKYCFGYSLTFSAGNNKIGAKIYSQTQDGFRNLLIIQKLINVDYMDTKVIDIIDLCQHGSGNVLVFDKLSGPWLANANNDDFIIDILKSFEKVYFQVDLSEYKANRIDAAVLQSIKAYFDSFYITEKEYEFGIEPVLIQDMYYTNKDDSTNKIVLNKIATGAAHEQSDDQYMKTLDELFDEFDRYFSEKYTEEVFYVMCRNTGKIIEPADAAYDLISNHMPQYVMTDEEQAKYGTNLNMFNQLIEEGLQRLTPAGEEERYRKQAEYEKYVILSTDNLNYFLFTYDTLNWARSNGILTGIGRGSAGGCLISYLLGITCVNPMAYNLIFERFLLPERGGLAPSLVTKMQDKIESKNYLEIECDDGVVRKFDIDAQFRIIRNDEQMTVYADELEEGDDIIWDNKDLLFAF